MKPRLYAVYYREGSDLGFLSRIMAPDSETAIKQARNIFKDKLSKLSGIELCSRMVPLERVVMKAKDYA